MRHKEYEDLDNNRAASAQLQAERSYSSMECYSVRLEICS